MARLAKLLYQFIKEGFAGSILFVYESGPAELHITPMVIKLN